MNRKAAISLGLSFPGVRPLSSQRFMKAFHGILHANRPVVYKLVKKIRSPRRYKSLCRFHGGPQRRVIMRKAGNKTGSQPLVIDHLRHGAGIID